MFIAVQLVLLVLNPDLLTYLYNYYYDLIIHCDVENTNQWQPTSRTDLDRIGPVTNISRMSSKVNL
jgi:hypothetical protein